MDKEITKEGLKIQSLLESLNKLENERADMRVEVTILSINNERLIERIKELEEIVDAGNPDAEEGESSNDEN